MRLIKNRDKFIQQIQLLNSIESAGIALLTVLKLRGVLENNDLYSLAFVVYFLTRMVQSFVTYWLMKEKK